MRRDAGIKAVGFWLCLSTLLCTGGAGQETSGPAILPGLRAVSAIVMEAKTGRVLFAKAPDRRLPPASTTKIMTALLLARDCPPQEPIRISPAAASLHGTTLGAKAGETFPAHDLLYALLLDSANDAAAAVAEKMDGSAPKFAARMNKEGERQRLPNTQFANPHGLPQAGHFASARDLANLTREALKNPAFDAAVRTRTYTIPRPNGKSLPLRNTNALLWTVPGMDGVKTGWTNDSGFCFVGSATRKGRRLITVVLNSSDWKADTAALLKYGFRQPNLPPNPLPEGKGNREQGTGNSNGVPAGQGGTQGHPGTAARPEGNGMAPNGMVRPKNPGTANTGSSFPAGPGSTGGSPPGNGVSAAPRQPGKNSSGTTEPKSPSDAVAKSGLGHEEGGVSKKEGGASPAPTGVLAPVPGRLAARTTPPDNAALLPPGSAPAVPPDTAPMVPPGTLPGSIPGAAGRLAPPATGLRLGTRANGAKTGRPKNDVSARKLAPPLSPATGLWARFVPKLPRLPEISWLWWLLLAIVAGFLLAWVLRHRREGMGKLHWPLLGGRRKKQEPQAQVAVEKHSPARTKPLLPETAGFVFAGETLGRRSSADWLRDVLDNPNRLLEPAVRRQARALLEAAPSGFLERDYALLNAPKPKMRVIAADLLSAVSPRRAEAALEALIQEEKLPSDVRAEAVQLLAQLSGDRSEPLWLQMLLRDGSAPAARALIGLSRLDEATGKGLHQALMQPRQVAPEADTELKQKQRLAHIACVLAAHGGLAPEEAAAHWDALAANYREPLLTANLRGLSAEWAVEKMVDTVLHGQPYPALTALLDTDPNVVRNVLPNSQTIAGNGTEARATVLRWLILGEGDDTAIKQLALDGDDLANGALQLAALHRWNATKTPPDALLAAAQIYALRSGFTPYPPERIAAAFRAASTGDRTPFLQSPELEPLADAYANPLVYDTVQTAMHREDGLGEILTTLARTPDNPAYQEELAFWSDKTPRSTRLLLTQTLAACDTPTAREALASRAADPDPTISAAARRFLRTVAKTPESVPIPVEAKPETVRDLTLDQAA